MAGTARSRKPASGSKSKAESKPNDPRDYIVLEKFRGFGGYNRKGDTLTLTPSQAAYYVVIKRLKLKEEAK